MSLLQKHLNEAPHRGALEDGPDLIPRPPGPGASFGYVSISETIFNIFFHFPVRGGCFERQQYHTPCLPVSFS